jgi:putative AlgH/UPF0301 family transcriptional regulator
MLEVEMDVTLGYSKNEKGELETDMERTNYLSFG